MGTILIYLLVFASEGVLTYLVSKRNIKVIEGNRLMAVVYDIGVSSCWWVILIGAFSTQKISLIILAIVGSAIGAFFASRRKIPI